MGAPISDPARWPMVNRITPGRRPAFLMFRHSRAGLFQDLPLAFGQALDAVRGNFVEDGVHFAFHEFVGGLFFIRFAGGRAPERIWPRAGADEFARGGAARREIPLQPSGPG